MCVFWGVGGDHQINFPQKNFSEKYLEAVSQCLLHSTCACLMRFNLCLMCRTHLSPKSPSVNFNPNKIHCTPPTLFILNWKQTNSANCQLTPCFYTWPSMRMCGRAHAWLRMTHLDKIIRTFAFFIAVWDFEGLLNPTFLESLLDMGRYEIFTIWSYLIKSNGFQVFIKNIIQECKHNLIDFFKKRNNSSYC